MAGTTWPVLVAGQKARASDVEAKFDWLEGHIVPMTGGNTTTGVYNLGTTTAKWKDLYLSNKVVADGGLVVGTITSTEPLDINYTSNFGGVFAKKSTNSNSWIKIENDARSFLIGVRGDSSDNFTIYDNVVSQDVLTIDTAGSLSLKNGTGINEFSTDTTLAGNSDLAVPTEKAVKTYVDGSLNELEGAATGTTNRVTTIAPGITGQTLQTLSLTVAGGLYVVQGTALFNCTNTSSFGSTNYLFELAAMVSSDSISTTIPNGRYSYVIQQMATATFAQVNFVGYLSLSSGGQTVYLQSSVGGSFGINTSTSWGFNIRRMGD